MDEYECGDVLGRGAFGAAFKVTRKHDRRDFVIKKVDIGKMPEELLARKHQHSPRRGVVWRPRGATGAARRREARRAGGEGAQALNAARRCMSIVCCVISPPSFGGVVHDRSFPSEIFRASSAGRSILVQPSLCTSSEISSGNGRLMSGFILMRVGFAPLTEPMSKPAWW